MWYDLLILAILIYSLIRGAMKGIIWQLAAIAAIVLCFFFSESASLLIAPHIGLKAPLNRWVAMLLLYFVFSFASFALARALREGLEKAKFEDFDRHLGALFGLAKGVLFAVVLTFFVVTIWEGSRSYITQTYSGYYAAVLMDRLHPVMPEELTKVLDPYINNLDHDGVNSNHQHANNNDGDSSHISFDDIFNNNPFTDPKTSNNGTYKEEGSTETEDAFVLFVKQLPDTLVSKELRDLMLVAVENTAPEDREELVHQLSSGVPSLMEQVAKDWSAGNPEKTHTEADKMTKMLDEIAGLYSESDFAKQSVLQDINSRLNGLPEKVIQGTVEDWHSDLMGYQNDPDTMTDMSTQLDHRILRQLSRARIALSSLDSHLRNRLRSSLPH